MFFVSTGDEELQYWQKMYRDIAERKAMKKDGNLRHRAGKGHSWGRGGHRGGHRGVGDELLVLFFLWIDWFFVFFICLSWGSVVDRVCGHWISTDVFSLNK